MYVRKTLIKKVFGDLRRFAAVRRAAWRACRIGRMPMVSIALYKTCGFQ
jgi:hypothetical protein